MCNIDLTGDDDDAIKRLDNNGAKEKGEEDSDEIMSVSNMNFRDDDDISLPPQNRKLMRRSSDDLDEDQTWEKEKKNEGSKSRIRSKEMKNQENTRSSLSRERGVRSTNSRSPLKSKGTRSKNMTG